MGFAAPLMLVGLVTLAVPIVIHLLNRRRFDVVDWGAMQFLQIGEATRRRLLLEDLLLLLLRMALIALLVAALAAPYSHSPLLAGLPMGERCDVVLLFDGSYSMGFTGSGKRVSEKGTGPFGPPQGIRTYDAAGGVLSPFQTPSKTAHAAAKEWARTLVDGLSSGDGVTLLQAKQQVVTALETTHDLERVRQAIEEMPLLSGGCDWPAAVQAAFRVLESSSRARREIVILTDGQRFGWADDACLLRWELLAQQLRNQPGPRPRVQVVNLDPGRPVNPPNWSLIPLSCSRGIASVGQEITFRTALAIKGSSSYRPPYRLRLEVDGRSAGDLKAPAAAPLDQGQVPLTFTHRFATPGSHLISVIVEADPPPEKRAADYAVRDLLPGDDQQDWALEVVPALPVLLVVGGPASRAGLGRPRRTTDFMRDALSPARDPTPVVRAGVVALDAFSAASLGRDLDKESGSKPRVLVLADVPRLTPEQEQAVQRFLAQGGGMLVTLGPRADPLYYNEQLYRHGQGWLPAKLQEITGNDAEPEHGLSPLATSFFHPALEIFREAAAGGLADARFARWWKLTTAGRASSGIPIALLANSDPLLVEGGFPSASGPERRGRVLLSAVPLDNTWRTNLTDLPAFAPLIHELVYSLASARSGEFNLQPGQPLVLRLDNGEDLTSISLQKPGEGMRPLRAAGRDAHGGPSPRPDTHGVRVTQDGTGRVLTFDSTRDPGVYRLKIADGRIIHYVVQSDHRESDLTACTPEDREKVRRLLPALEYVDNTGELVPGSATVMAPRELWQTFFIAVIVLLCGELWLTRRIVWGR